MDGGTVNAPDKGDVLVTQIRAAVMKRGIALVTRQQSVLSTEIEPLKFVLTVQGALERARLASAKAHVMQLARAIADGAARHGGPVQVGATSWLLLQTYAETGEPPKRSEQVIERRSPVARVLP